MSMPVYRCPKAFLAFAALAALSPVSANADGLPPTHSATYGLPTHRTPAVAPQPIEETDLPTEWPSLVFQTGDGSLLASTRVNEITCRTLASDDAGQSGIEWLGTQMGVKAIDTGRRRVALYTRHDGLPGDYVEAIASSSTRVYCLVRIDSPNTLALCMTDLVAGDGHWVALATIDAKVDFPDLEKRQMNPSVDYAWTERWGRSHLALMPDGGVLVSPSAVDLATQALVYRWDNHQLSSISSDGLPQADKGIVGVNDFCVDGKAQVAYLATTTGLFSVNVSGGAPVWHRLLDDKRIDALLLAPPISGSNGSQILYAACHARLKSNQAAWDDRRNKIPSLLATVAVSAGSEVGFVPGPADFTTGDYDRGGAIVADAITRSADGAIWLTERGRYDYNGRMGYDLGGFSRYDPGARRWKRFDLNETPIVALAAQALPKAAGEIPASAKTVLAFAFKAGDDALSDDSESGNLGERVGIAARDWRETYFPNWTSPPAEAERSERARLDNGTFYDPFSRQERWSAEGQQLLVTTLSSAKGHSQESVRARYTLHAGIQRVPPRIVSIASALPGKQTLFVQCVSGIYQLTDAGEREPVWKRTQGASDGNEGSAFSLLDVQLARAGSDYIVVNPEGQFLKRYDSSTGHFVNTKLVKPESGTLLGAGASGFWITVGYDPQFVALHADRKKGYANSTPQSIPKDLPADLMPPDGYGSRTAIGVSGSIVWLATRIQRRPNALFPGSDPVPATIGYDIARKRWTSPLEMDPQHADDGYCFSAADGSTYTAQLQKRGSVFRYDPAANSWAVAAPPLTGVGNVDYQYRSQPYVIAADEREIYLTDGQRLIGYDRRQHAWSATALPDRLKIWGAGNLWGTATATSAAVWIGSDRGLFRFDRARRTFRQIDYPVSLDPLPPPKAEPYTAVIVFPHIDGNRWRDDALLQPHDLTLDAPDAPVQATLAPVPSGAELKIAAVDRHSVWGLVKPFGGDYPLVFRFDRATRRFALFPLPLVALPLNSTIPLRSDGDALWILGYDTCYRLNLRSGHFDPVFTVRVPEDAKVSSPVPHGYVGSVVADTANADLAYVTIAKIPYSTSADKVQPTILYRFHKSTGKFDPLPIDAATLNAARPLLRMLTPAPPALGETAPEDTIASVYGTGALYADTNSIWIGTTIGVFRVDRATGQWFPATLPDGTPIRMEALDIHADPHGAPWISNRDTAIRLSSPAAVPKVFTTAQR